MSWGGACYAAPPDSPNWPGMGMAAHSLEFLTTKELAALLRIKERKVYDLAASGAVPCNRATGKLLFPRAEIEAWLRQSASHPPQVPPAGATEERPPVVLGSHDPLLEWALRQSGSELATYFDGSLDGLERFANGEGVAAGLHLYEGIGAGGGEGAHARRVREKGEQGDKGKGGERGKLKGGEDGKEEGATDATPCGVRSGAGNWPGNASGNWNVGQVATRLSGAPVVLLEWAWRERGLILRRDLAPRPQGLADLKGLRIVPRQPTAGSQLLFEQLCALEGLCSDELDFMTPERNETDAALAVAEGRGDMAFGLKSVAAQLGLGFVPIVRERFDLLVARRAWFEPALQRLDRFCRSEAFRKRAASLDGYDVSGYGRVHFNG